MACCILAGLVLGAVLTLYRAALGFLGRHEDALDWSLDP